MRRQLITFVSMFALQAVAVTPEPLDVYRITAEGCSSAVESRVQTGFSLIGQGGIITALHGVVGCNDLSAVSGRIGLTGLNLDEVDVSRDLAVIGVSRIPREQGLAPGPTPRHSGRARVLGHPHAISGLHEMTLEIPNPPTRPLRETVPGTLFEILRARKSPEPSVRVVSVNGDLQPGHSGAPILDEDGRVVGVASGGIGHGEYGLAWAVPLQDAQWRPARAERRRLDELVRHAADGLFWSPGSAGAAQRYPRRVSLWRYADGRVSGVFADPTRNVVYVNTFEKIRIFDFENESTADIEVGSLIQGMALSPDARKAYVVVGRPRTLLKLVDLQGERVVRNIEMPRKKVCPPTMSPSGKLLLVPMPSDGEIWVYNTRGGRSHTARLEGGAGACAIVMSRRTGKVYVGVGRNQVRVFEGADFYRDEELVSSQAVFDVGRAPRGLVEDFSGSFLYVSNMRSGTVSVIDLNRGVESSAVRVGKGPWGVAMTPDSRWLYVANRGDATVSVIDAQRQVVVETLQVDRDPTNVVISRSGDRVYIGHFYQNSVTLIE